MKSAQRSTEGQMEQVRAGSLGRELASTSRPRDMAGPSRSSLPCSLVTANGQSMVFINIWFKLVHHNTNLHTQQGFLGP